MSTQSIDLSAVKNMNFNGTEIKTMNLNGSEIWTKPASSGNVFYLNDGIASGSVNNSGDYTTLQNGEYICVRPSSPELTVNSNPSNNATYARRGEVIIVREAGKLYLGYTVNGDSNYIYQDPATDPKGLAELNTYPHGVAWDIPVNRHHMLSFSPSPLYIIVGEIDSNLNIINRTPAGSYDGVTAANLNYNWVYVYTTTTLAWSGDNVTISYVTNSVENNYAITLHSWTSNAINVENVFRPSESRSLYNPSILQGENRIENDRNIWSISIASATGTQPPIGDTIYLEKV